MSSYSFKLPDLGEGAVESEIVEWRVRVGDPVEADQPLVDVMTEKATVEITSPVSGKILSLTGGPGDTIPVGAELAVFDTGFDTGPAEAEPATGESRQTAEPQTSAADKPLSSPAVRQLAREKNIDLAEVPATGPEGRITRADVLAFIDQGAPAEAAQPGGDSGAVSEIKITGLRRKTAERMTLSATRIPHFTYIEEVDVTELEQLRRQLNLARTETAPELSYLPFFMRALVRALKQFPQCNAHFDDARNVIIRHPAVHIGIATQTGNGLLAPVVRDVQDLDLRECALALREITEKARSGGADRTELSGSTITLSSLGALGGIAATPVINPPEVAIIGVNRARECPVVKDRAVTIRRMMNLSCSFDHRVLDGYDAALFVQAIKRHLEFPATIFV